MQVGEELGVLPFLPFMATTVVLAFAASGKIAAVASMRELITKDFL
jgi:hypothetical protein